MTVQLNYRRGTSAEIATFIGTAGEPVYNTSTGQVHIMDGVTAGGRPLAGANTIVLTTTNQNVPTGDFVITGGEVYIRTGANQDDVTTTNFNPNTGYLHLTNEGGGAGITIIADLAAFDAATYAVGDIVHPCSRYHFW